MKDKLLSKVNSNKERVHKICNLMKKDTGDEAHLVDATMEHFSSCSAPIIESFLLACRKDIQVKSRLPKKGKLQAAIDGEQNMIHLAFDLRTNENHIEKEYDNLKKTREKIVRLKQMFLHIIKLQ